MERSSISKDLGCNRFRRSHSQFLLSLKLQNTMVQLATAITLAVVLVLVVVVCRTHGAQIHTPVGT